MHATYDAARLSAEDAKALIFHSTPLSNELFLLVDHALRMGPIRLLDINRPLPDPPLPDPPLKK